MSSMNLKDIREKALSALSWQVEQDDSFVLDVNDRVNEALRQLSADCPQALLPDVASVEIGKDETTTTLGGVYSTADEFVFDFGLVASGETAPPADRTWDGVKHIEFFADGRWRRRQTREWWLVRDPQTHAVTHRYVSLYEPWKGIAFTNADCRVFEPEFSLPDDVDIVRDGKSWDGQHRTLEQLPDGYDISSQETDYRGDSNSTPRYYVRGRYFQVEAPTEAPGCTAVATSPTVPEWDPLFEPYGTFDYVYTYAFGALPSTTRSGRPVPRWESAPSPVSAEVTIVKGFSIAVGSPNIAWSENFDSGTLRDGRSGLYKKFYRRRKTVTAGAPHSAIETPDVFMHVFDVEDDAVVYYDDGTDIPDRGRRLPYSHGYYLYRVVPHQDDRYEFDFRVRKNVIKLSDNTDAPAIHDTALNAVLTLTQWGILQMDRRTEEADSKFRHYKKHDLPALMKNLGNPAKRIPARVWDTGLTEKIPRLSTYRSVVV